MKFAFLILVFISNFAFAHAPDADIPHQTPTDKINEDVAGAIAQPTAKQKKQVKAPAKKKAQKRSHQKHAKVSKSQKNKKATK